MQGTARPSQSKPDRGQSRCIRIYYLGRNDLDHTITFAIGTRRWEYHLTPQQCESVEYLAKHISTGKALSYAKRKAQRAECLQ